MRAPKILAVASAVDLDFRYGCTPAWWQLWKGLCEEGVDLIVTPYRGRPIESPWWRTAPNPTYVEGESFARARDVVAKLKGDAYLRRAEDNPEDGLGDRMTREVIWRWVTPRWQKHLESLIERERPDAVIVFTVPMAHLRGIPSALRAQVRHPGRLLRRRRADEPAGVRRHGHGLQLVPRGRSVRVRPAASRTRRAASSGCASSARAAQRRSSGAPIRSSSRRRRSRRSTTSSSTATATSSAATGCRRWSASRRGRCRTRTSRSAAATSRATSGTARPIGDIPFNVFARAISAARINLCITRRSHATVYASSSCRPFELASAGAAIVSNPYNGLERWFEPGSELLIVDDADEAIAGLPRPARRPGQAEEMGRRARERVLDEHTYRHRARQLLSLVDVRVPA